MKNILERDRAGDVIALTDPEYDTIRKIIDEAQEITAELNHTFHNRGEVRELFSCLTGAEVDETFQLLPPFYTDFGKNIRVGKNVFINHACTFMDRGGITVGDGALIGPKVNLITINHVMSPSRRSSTVCKPVVIGKKAWLGVGATVLPGVTIGDNAVVSAGAVVTKNVPPNVVVAGVPARVIGTVAEEKQG
ncbi:MAG: sugar O-acetyltransferase [Christensenella sp.]|uniref:sugar O-acetyltransferase n=1 Tax=Christensenella sp. TaxID=1935934 RepID=UPI002B207032|nr:sugar O-acetyltransferase [Christensenella sp.]MEA5002163.1 sugar O-acetyltransferase [Christensenella sp.]